MPPSGDESDGEPAKKKTKSSLEVMVDQIPNVDKRIIAAQGRKLAKDLKNIWLYMPYHDSYTTTKPKEANIIARAVINQILRDDATYDKLTGLTHAALLGGNIPVFANVLSRRSVGTWCCPTWCCH